MGCCGCSLYASTITAGIFSLIDCILFIVFDIFMMIYLTSNTLKNWSYDQNYQSLIKGFNDLDSTIAILVGLRIAIRFLWLISTFVLFRGNSKEYRKFLYTWELLTVTRIILGVATSIYGLVKFMEDMKLLFDSSSTNLWTSGGKLVAEFIVLINFLELGPIWLIILIALVIFVHQRGIEIERKKNTTNQYNSWNSNTNQYSHTNGQSQYTSQLAHPTSLTAQPKPLTIPKIEETKRLSTTNSVEPILQINEIISIPRVKTLLPPKDYNEKSIVKPSHIERRNSNKSALAQRTSYLFNDSGRDSRDSSKIPQRNFSYNYGQKPERYAYDNRGFNNVNENLNKPVSIKRASLQRK